MNWGLLFNLETLLALALPVGVGIVVIIILYFLRRIFYKHISKWVARTKTCFDDILFQDTRIATLLWCVWLGIFVGFVIYEAPAAWAAITERAIPLLFAVLGVYTIIMFIMSTFRWYKVEICPRTTSSLDDIVTNTLILLTPIVGTILGIILILYMLDVSMPVVTDWLRAHGLKLAVLVVLGVTLLMLTILLVPGVIRRAVFNSRTDQTRDELEKRADTLISVVGTTLQITIMFIFLLMILSELTINIAAILTGAGVVGLAIGFGAQSLVKDVLAGLFVIMENQYRKGDVVKIADVSGTVEEINLRRTVLRDLDGITHVVPNGEIRVASNYTKQWARANFNIRVSLDTDLDKAMAVIDRVGKELAEDPQWAPLILTPPRATRVDNISESGIEIKVLGDTKPVQQWAVMGQLRLRLKKAFDKEGIEIPWPHTKVLFGNVPPQPWPRNGESAQEKGEPEKN